VIPWLVALWAFGRTVLVPISNERETCPSEDAAGDLSSDCNLGYFLLRSGAQGVVLCISMVASESTYLVASRTRRCRAGSDLACHHSGGYKQFRWATKWARKSWCIALRRRLSWLAASAADAAVVPPQVRGANSH
jgi:hypothetical protein